jgi:hypothetical protein
MEETKTENLGLLYYQLDKFKDLNGAVNAVIKTHGSELTLGEFSTSIQNGIVKLTEKIAQINEQRKNKNVE